MYPDNVRELFPGCKDLVDLNVGGYVGVPLGNYLEQVIGILCALFRNPVRPTRDMQEILEIIGVKAAAEIKRMELLSTLKASEEHFHTILHSLQFRIVIIDEKNHVILEANQKALDLVGAENDTLSDLVCHRFICPAGRKPKKH